MRVPAVFRILCGMPHSLRLSAFLAAFRIPCGLPHVYTGSRAAAAQIYNAYLVYIMLVPLLEVVRTDVEV